MRYLVVMVVMAFVIGACGSDEGDETEPTVPQGTPGEVILEISDEGGFVPVEFNLTRIPRFTVFADGTVIMPGDQQFSFPGPAIRPLMQSQLEDDVMTELLTFVGDMGLADVDSIDLNNAPNVADASTTVVRYFDADGEHRISIYALGFESGAADARPAIVASMIDRLATATAETSAEPFVADRLVAYALGTEGLDPQQVRNAGAWPLEIKPDDMTAQVAGFSCATVEGDDAKQLTEALEDADAMTTWSYEGAEFRILARPLLPHQEGC